MNDLQRLFDRIREIQEKDSLRGVDANWLLRSVGEEFGECCAAVASECGDKPKRLKEAAKVEAVDLILCAAALYFETGGQLHELPGLATRSSTRWKRRGSNRSTEGSGGKVTTP